MYNNTQKLLELKELKVKNIKIIKGTRYIKVEMPRKPHICPCCSQETNMIHDYLPERKIKDIPFGISKTVLLYRARRYHCKCGKNFVENKEQILSNYQMTQRYLFYILEKLGKKVSFKDVAKDMGVSITTVMRIFDLVKYSVNDIGEYICIDEFKGNLGDYKYQAVMIDPQTSKVLNIFKNRFKHDLSKEFSTIPKERRYKVKFFICDMWDTYIELAKWYFPNAEIVVDRFHYTRYVTGAMDQIRREIQNTLGKELRVHMKHSRALLLGRHDKVIRIKKYDAEDELMEMLNLSEKLTSAYQLEQAFYKVNDSNSREEARTRLREWYELVEQSGLEEFKKVAATFQHYDRYILNSFDTKYTNSYAEGVNNLIKTIKRIGFGFRNLDRFRNKLMHVQNYQAA